MSKNYLDMMEHVHMTPEMEDRILRKIQTVEFKPRNHRIPGILAAAACLLLVLSLPIFLSQPSKQEQESQGVQMINGMEKAESLEALSQMVGFRVPELKALPFAVKETVYTSYWNKMAQIVCIGEDVKVEFRMVKGAEDSSGDYTVYGFEESLEIDGVTVTLKGSDADAFTLAIWSDSEYSYSLKMTPELSRQQFGSVIEGFINSK